MQYDESIMARLAVLENTVRECLPVIDKVFTLEADMRHLNSDITELKELQATSRQERQEQYDSLMTVINNHHEKMVQSFTEGMKNVDQKIEPLSTQLKSINTIFSTLVWICAAIGGVLTIIFAGMSVMMK